MSDVDEQMNALVARALTKDPDAVNQLLRVIRPLVVRYCRTRLGGYERANTSADDVAQEVCLAVLRALPGYQEQGKPFLAFVYGIAQHKVVDAHRSAGRDRSDPVDELPEAAEERDGPEQHALNLSASADMAALLDKLPEKQREVLRLRIVVGLSAEETAQAVGSSPGAVRVAQHRALSRLRQLIGEAAEGAADAPAPTRRAPAPGARPAPRPAPGTPPRAVRGRAPAAPDPGPPTAGVPRPAPRPPISPAGGSPASPGPGAPPGEATAGFPTPIGRRHASPSPPGASQPVPAVGPDTGAAHRSPAARTGDDDLDRLLDLADANADRDAER